MFFVQLLLRLIGLSPKAKSAAEIKKQQTLDRNKKLHIIMNAMRAHEEVRGQTQGQNIVSGDKGQSAGQSQTVGEALKQSAQKHEQTAVIGKSKEGKEGWKQRTGKSRTVRKRIQRSKGRALSLWR